MRDASDLRSSAAPAYDGESAKACAGISIAKILGGTGAPARGIIPSCPGRYGWTISTLYRTSDARSWSLAYTGSPNILELALEIR
jgi:hypothetical protein